MGAVSSSCESCFGGKTSSDSSSLNPKSPAKNTRYSELKTEVHMNRQTDYRIAIDATRSLKTRSHASMTKRNRQKSGGGGEEFNLSPSSKKVSIEDFTKQKVLGRGAFGTVYLAQKKGNKTFFALKTLKKRELIKEGSVEHIMTEKRVLENAVHPFIVKLCYSFQNKTRLYFVLEFCAGGELFTHLRKKGQLDEESIRFYASEIVLGLQYLHEALNVIYRDLKPENILLDSTGHIKITDFGLSKVGHKATTMCGTPQYMAPELFMNQDYDKAVDWWSLGCLVYEMAVGHPPFSSTDDRIGQDILKIDPMIPSHLSEKTRDFLSRLLTKDPTKRLGFKGAEEVKNHPFFGSTNWHDVLTLKKQPPIVPMLTRADDLRNFDKGFLHEKIAETPAGSFTASQEADNPFMNFSYMPRGLGDGKYTSDGLRVQ